MKKPLSFGLWAIGALSFAASIYLLSVLQRSPVATYEEFLAPPPEHIEYFHFGFRESMADSFWLRWVQSADVCQTYNGPVKSVDEIVDIKADPLLANQRHRICDNSWSYKMLDTVTRLAPRFKMAYLGGGSMLAVAVEDYAGATVIFDRGIEQFPTDWPLLYRAAYHFLYDVRDLPKAAALLVRASDSGAPTWVKSLASRIYTQAGQLELGISVLENYRKTVESESVKRLVDERINELKAKRAKEP